MIKNLPKNPHLFFSAFPLQLAAVAGVLAAFSAVLAHVPPVAVIVRGLLAVLVFALLGQLLSYLWQSLSALGQANTEHPIPDSAEANTAHTAALPLSAKTIPASPAGSLADLASLSPSLESPKTKPASPVLPVSLAEQPPTTGKN
ncbi:MAG: hypothetical protein AB7I41_05605 [Candidatus Sericytochromatia bacterium]